MPDLRESGIVLSPHNFRSVVHDGALLQNGMPNYDDLTDQELREIYAYTCAGAHAALAPEPTPSSR